MIDERLVIIVEFGQLISCIVSIGLFCCNSMTHRGQSHAHAGHQAMKCHARTEAFAAGCPRRSVRNRADRHCFFVMTKRANRDRNSNMKLH